MQEDNNERLRSLVEEVSAKENEKGSIEQKIADLYNSAMDSAKLNGEYYWYDLEGFLLCDGYQNTREITNQWLNEVWPRMQRQGVPGLFAMYISADEKDSKNNLVTIVQGGLTLGQKDYYVDQDARSEEIRRSTSLTSASIQALARRTQSASARTFFASRHGLQRQARAKQNFATRRPTTIKFPTQS